MNILYVTSENIYGTGSSNLRNISIIEGFISLGHHVSILSMEPDEKAKKFDSDIKARLEGTKCYFLQNNSLQKVFAVKKTSRKNKMFSKVRQTLYKTVKSLYLKFSPDTLMQAVHNVNKDMFPKEQYDIVISSSDPVSSHHLAKMFLSSSQQHSRWIQYWGDPLFLDITRKTANKKKMKKIEEGFLRDADKVVYTNPLVLEEQKKLYNDCSKKMCFVPTPFSFTKDNTSGKTDFEIGYFGSYMSCVRDIMPLCEAARQHHLRLIVMGGGDQTIPESDMISVWPFQGTQTVTEYENKCKVLVCICNQPKNGKTVLQIPGKIYHYAMTDKPIMVVGADPKTRSYLGTFNRYYFTNNDAESIYNTFKTIIDGKSIIKNSPVNDFRNDIVADHFLS